MIEWLLNWDIILPPGSSFHSLAGDAFQLVPSLQSSLLLLAIPAALEANVPGLGGILPYPLASRGSSLELASNGLGCFTPGACEECPAATIVLEPSLLLVHSIQSSWCRYLLHTSRGHLFLLPGLGFTSSALTGCNITLLASCCVFFWKP